MWNQTTTTTMKKTTCGVLRTHPRKPGVPATLCTKDPLKDEHSDSVTCGEGAAEEGVRLLGREEERPSSVEGLACQETVTSAMCLQHRMCTQDRQGGWEGDQMAKCLHAKWKCLALPSG